GFSRDWSSDVCSSDLESAPGIGSQQPQASADEQALERYRYMLRTAPPETIEQAHEEAFAKLTPEQRAEVLRDLAEVTPPEERAGDRKSVVEGQGEVAG